MDKKGNTLWGYIVLLFVVVFYSCEKKAGEGGTSSIRGIVIKQEINNSGEIKKSYNAPDEKVYIIYGTDEKIYDDNTNTHFDGSYSFDFLKKGSYQLFAYSECKEDTCPNLVPVFATVEINESNQTVNAADIIIRDE